MDNPRLIPMGENGMGIQGRLDARSSPGLRQAAEKAVKTLAREGSQNFPLDLSLDLSGVTYLDTTGAALILHIQSLAARNQTRLTPRGLAPEFIPILEQIETAPKPPGKSRHRLPPIHRLGKDFETLFSDIPLFIHFTGRLTHLLTALKRIRSIRWKDTLITAEQAGVNALPIVALISFILGLVMAFQSAVPMEMFGAELYVANLIGIAMVRELGPLMTAIVMAGRSASAFAAEIGTMKINEEIDALTVMGMDPMEFLILPRIIAATLVTPLLTIFANLMGIFGGALVLLSFDHPFMAYYHQIVGFVSWGDLAGGLAKSLVFGFLIAAVGCLRGFEAGRGPSAVGDATTKAVVSSIILIAVFDGVFSILFYTLGL